MISPRHGSNREKSLIVERLAFLTRLAQLLVICLLPTALAGQERSERDEEIGRGILLTDIGRHREAVEWLQRAVDRYPDFAPAYSNLGIAFLQAGDTAAAITAFERAVELAPEEGLYRKNLGNTYTDAERYDDAIAQHRKAIELEPNSAGHHVDLGVAFAWGGQLDSAIAEMQVALSHSPNHVLALLNLTLYHGQRQEWMEALEAQIRMADVDEWHPEHTVAASIAYEIRETLEREAKERPDDPLAHYYLAYVKNFDGGDYKAALKEVEKAIKLDDSVAEFYKAQGLFHSHRRKHKDARKALQRCIEIDPDYWQCQAWLGFTYINLEESEDAVQALERAVQLAPDAINARLQLGVAYQQVERFEDSAVQLQSAIDLGHGHPMTRYNLAVAYYLMDRYQVAWVHATIARNMGWKSAEVMLDDLEQRLDGQPECYFIADDVACSRP